MARSKATPTRYPGVHSLGPGKWRIRAQWADDRTRRTISLDRIVDAPSATAAAKMRATAILDAQNANKPSERPTFAEYAESWMRSRLPTLRASTRSRYATLLDLHILPHFGELYLDAITRADVLDFRDRQMTRTVRDRNGTTRTATTSAQSVNGRMRVLHGIIADAHMQGLIDRDPMQRLPALHGEAARRKDLDAAELARFLSAARELEPKWYPFFVISAYTGMRFGEVSALRWDAIDEPRGVIRVDSAQWKGHIAGTKTRVKREVPLTPELVAALRWQRARLERDDHPGLTEGLVFPARRARRGTGGAPAAALMHNTAPRRAVARCLEAAGIDRAFSIHGFRHTLNNLIRQVAQAEVVRSITGHSSAEMTHHYSHVGAHEKRDAVGRVLRLVHGGSTAPAATAPGTDSQAPSAPLGTLGTNPGTEGTG